MSASAPRIAGVILAGGRGLRFGGRDKGLLRLRGTPLAQLAAARLAPQVDELCISSTRHRSRHRLSGAVPVIADAGPAHSGPLAGLASALARTRAPLLAALPCDSPAIPADYIARLWRRLRLGGADICVVRDRGGLHPLHLLMKTRLRADLQRYLAGGGAAVHRWLMRQRWTSIRLDVINLNHPAELRARTIKRHGPGGL